MSRPLAGCSAGQHNLGMRHVASLPGTSWTPAEDALVLSLPPRECERRTLRTNSAVRARRVKLKRLGKPVTDLRFLEERVKAGRSIWTPKADAVVRRTRPAEAAMNLGVTPRSVYRRRKALGLPKFWRTRKSTKLK